MSSSAASVRATATELSDELAAAQRRRGDLIGGKYVLGQVLGIGGMGVVYEATQPCLDRTIAVKLLCPALANDPRMRRRFRSEAIAGSRLSHRNVAAVLDFNEGSGADTYLAMEYVRGPLLSQLVTESGPFELHRITNLVGQLLGALAEVHAMGIVHADVKSDNILIERLRDGTERTKLIDFGLARFAGEVRERGEQVSGTPEYIAPEIVRGQAPSPASDLYAVGVILYELMTGATPFAGGTSGEILARHTHDDVIPPSQRCPERDFPLLLERVVLCALRKDPADRFADANAFAAALAAATVDARSSEPPPRTLPKLPFSTEAPTGDWRTVIAPRRFPAHTPAHPKCTGSPAREARQLGSLRKAVGDALLAGDVDRVVVAYLELARALIDERSLGMAAKELEEGIDLLTIGEQQTPEPVWRLMLSLAALYDGLGDPLRARRTAAAARDHATRVRSAVGRERAQVLMRRLVA